MCKCNYTSHTHPTVKRCCNIRRPAKFYALHVVLMLMPLPICTSAWAKPHLYPFVSAPYKKTLEPSSIWGTVPIIESYQLSNR